MVPVRDADYTLVKDAPAWARWAVYVMEKFGFLATALAVVTWATFTYLIVPLVAAHTAALDASLAEHKANAAAIIATQREIVATESRLAAIAEDLRAGQTRSDQAHTQMLESLRHKSAAQ